MYYLNVQKLICYIKAFINQSSLHLDYKCLKPKLIKNRIANKEKILMTSGLISCEAFLDLIMLVETLSDHKKP